MSAPSSPIENISDTALWVAYYRAMESERKDALFHDSYARLLAGERGEKIVHTLPIGRSSAWSMIVRTAVMDEIILRTIEKEHCDTVLNLAAGLDTRPYRLPLPTSLHWIEVDLPAIFTYKEEQLAGEQPHCLLERFKLDLSHIVARNELFARTNAEAKRALVITEGLLPYLTNEQVRSLAQDLHAQPHFRWWLTEFISPYILKYMHRSWDKSLAAGNAQMHFAVEDNEGFYRELGWTVSEFRSSLVEAHRLKREMPYAWLIRLVMRLSPRQKQEYYRKMSGYALLARASSPSE